MTVFGEKVRKRREELQMSQETLGELCGVSRRTIVSYETGGKFPHKSTLQRLSMALGATMLYLTDDRCTDPMAGSDEEPYVKEAWERYGKKGAEEMASLLKRNEALFAGGTLSESQKDMFFEAVSRAYFINKKQASVKFGRKSVRREANAGRGGCGGNGSGGISSSPVPQGQAHQ